MEIRLERGPVDEAEAYRLLDEWWAAQPSGQERPVREE
jgi:hypothetical protein